MDSLRRTRALDFRPFEPGLQHVADMAEWVVADDDSHSGCFSVLGDIAWSDHNISIHSDPGAPDKFTVSFGQIADFVIDFAKRDIVICNARKATPETINHLLRDQIVPRIVAHGRRLVLHSAGIIGPSGATLLVGLSGVGKSTLAASLHKSGFSLLGDDAMMISDEDGKSLCLAIYRSLRLFPDSVGQLLDDQVQHSPVASYTAKRNVVGLAGDEGTSAPIRAVFVMGAEVAREVEIYRLAPSTACLSFVEHSFWLDPTDLARTKQRMQEASVLASRVPTFSLNYPKDYSWLPKIHRAIAQAASGEGVDSHG